MYESEVNGTVDTIEKVPINIQERFLELRRKVIARTVLPWGEHCTECVWPTCYTTCDLYAPRLDGACRQFVDGMVRVDLSDSSNGYLLKLTFKRWAKLWTVGNLGLRSAEEALKAEKRNITIGSIGLSSPLPGFVKAKVLHKISYARRMAAERTRPSVEAPDCFVIECYNPGANAVLLTFTVRSQEKRQHAFQAPVNVAPGFIRKRIAFADISQGVDLLEPFEVEITPNASENCVLYFGLIDFVKEQQEKKPAGERFPKKAEHWKCVVWDLDNTLWDGTLVEDGPDKVRIREGVVDVIKRLDERGILLSIASKNNHDDAMSVLRRHGLDAFFLHPKIAWQPKSKSISEIAQLLNIGSDSIAFVDDQEFEREEVRAVLPATAVIDGNKCLNIPDRPESQVPVTAESKSRRLMYREQEERQIALDTYQGDYRGFLKSCQLEVNITPLEPETLERAYELSQRTNQLNFSGNRYSKAQLQEVMNDPNRETWVIDCSDRFGNYGIVGLAVVDTREPRLLDLMFSCRVQHKRVEHAVLCHMLKRFVVEERRDFYATYRKTAKNAPGGKVFEETGFECDSEAEGVLSLVFRRSKEIEDDGVIAIKEGGRSCV